MNGKHHLSRGGSDDLPLLVFTPISLNKIRHLRYTVSGAECTGCHHNGRRLCPLSQGVILLCPLSLCGKGVVGLVTYDELFQFCLVLIGLAGLIIQIIKKK